MAFSLNEVNLIGNLGKEPEFKVTPSGVSMCKFSVATKESFKNKDEQWEERTEWHNIECWRNLADNANKFLKKGSKVFAKGKLKTEQYEKDGTTRYITKIVAVDLIFLESSNNAQNQATQAQTAPRQTNTRPVQTQAYTPEMESEAWEDVPL